MVLILRYLHELGEIETDIDIEYGTSEDSTNDFEVTDAQMKNVAYLRFLTIKAMIILKDQRLQFKKTIRS